MQEIFGNVIGFALTKLPVKVRVRTGCGSSVDVSLVK